MKHYILALLLLCCSLLNAETELFCGVDPLSGALSCQDVDFQPIFKDGKVVTLLNAKDQRTAYNFYYTPTSTVVESCSNHRFLFEHDGTNLLVKKVWNSDGSLFSSEKWDYADGPLISHSFYDEAGGLVYQQKIEQDEHSILITTLDQDKVEWIKSDYENSRLVRQAHSNGSINNYLYNSNNQVTAEIKTYPQGSLRQFYFRDAEGFIQEIITDNGCGEDPSSLEGVSDRSRIEIIPSMHKPEVIILHRYNPELGAEMVVKRIEGIYNQDAKLIFEEFFDIQAPKPSETYFEYDAIGHLTMLHDGNGNGVESIYDIDHHILRESQIVDYRPIASTIYGYDGADHPSSCDKIDVNGQADPCTYIYNSLNQVSCSIDFKGNQTHYEYNPLGQLVTTIHPAVLDANDAIIRPTQRWCYDFRGRLYAYIDPRGDVHDLTNPEKTPLKTQNNPWTPRAFPLRIPLSADKGSVEPHLSEAGTYGTKLVISNDCDTQTTYLCDALNRVTEVKVSTLDGSVRKHERMRYDAAGNPELLSWLNGKNWITTQWIYGQNGRVEQVIEGAHTPHQRITCYSYDDQNRLDGICKPDGITIRFTYDENNILSHIVSSDGTVNQSFKAIDPIVKQYDDQNRCIGFILPDGSSASYDWDGDQLKAIYRIDENGNIAYEFSAEDFLLEEKGRLVKSRSLSKTADQLYQIEQCGGRRYQTDSNGNIVSIKTKNETLELRYDALDRLTAVISDDGHSYHYSYDGQNRRTERIACIDENEVTHEQYLYDGNKEIGLVRNGKIVEFRLLDPQQQSEIGSTIALELDGAILRPVHDAHKNILRLISLEGEDEACYKYDLWRERSSSDETHCCPWRYRGKRTDEETGFVFFGRRYYMPYERQWLTLDPLGHTDGANRYEFCGGNPDKNQDHYGLFVFENPIHSISTATFSLYDWIKDHISFETTIKNDVDLISKQLFSNAWLVMIGYYSEEMKVGVVGNGELNDKVRVTIINGMLNNLQGAEENAMEVSKTHADINVHYVYRPTRGWTHDLIKATLGKFGFTSPEAQLLAQTWRELIQEMGGINGGGTIVHYAHSIGAADTISARLFLTPEEQKMIKVISLGSPLVIPHEGFGHVINYISINDGIRYLILFTQKHNLVYLDSYWGIPIIDHLLNSGTYKTLLETLGKAFIKEYLK